MGSSVNKAVQQALPANLTDNELVKQALPGLQDQISNAAKNVNLTDLNPFSKGGGESSTAPAPESGGFLNSIGNFFKDDPNSGWYDNMQKEAAEKARIQSIMNSGGMSPADLLRANDNLPNAQTASSSSGGIGDIFSKALKKVASPVGLETLGGVAGGLGSMYLNNQGTKAATAGQDQAQELIRQASAADLENIGKVGDSQEQLAYRQQAMKGISDRASMGLTPEDQAALQGINRQSAQQFKANNATIGQDMQRRGMANSGLGLAQSMGAADQALQNQALAGQNQAAQSFNAKQGALNNLAGASNTALQSDYARQMGKATNLSAVNQFNAQQQGARAANKGTIQQDAKTAQGQGVQNIVKGVIGQGFFDKEKKV